MTTLSVRFQKGVEAVIQLYWTVLPMTEQSLHIKVQITTSNILSLIRNSSNVNGYMHVP